MLVIAAPGQGAQAPGFLAPWLELPGFADRLAAWSDLAGLRPDHGYGTAADADEIRDTAVAQPLLVAAAIAAAEALLRRPAARPSGRSRASPRHSVGELAAGRHRRRALPRGRDAPGPRCAAEAMADAAAADGDRHDRGARRRRERGARGHRGRTG